MTPSEKDLMTPHIQRTPEGAASAKLRRAPYLSHNQHTHAQRTGSFGCKICRAHARNAHKVCAGDLIRRHIKQRLDGSKPGSSSRAPQAVTAGNAAPWHEAWHRGDTPENDLRRPGNPQEARDAKTCSESSLADRIGPTR